MTNHAGNTRGSTYAALAVTLAAALAVGATTVATGAWSTDPPTSDGTSGEIAQTMPSARLDGASYADVVDTVSPAVVTIRTERQPSRQLTAMRDNPFREFFGPGFGQPEHAPRQRGLGSGVIVRKDGYILTNNHVIDGATSIQVELGDRRVVEGTLIGADPASDLAVIRVETSDLPVITLGDSDQIRVGDLVLAIGNPLGVGQTVTMGIVSAKGRATNVGDGSFEDFLQTDAAINPGNSGGALITTGGQLIGINSQILSPSGGNIGIGFAVPVNMAKNVMEQLIEEGRVRRGRLGVTVQTVTSDIAAGLGLTDVQGALVADITAGGPADEAGLRRGDVIVGLQDQPVADSNTLRNEVASSRPGTTIALDVVRDGKPTELRATLGELDMPSAEEGARVADRTGDATFGMSVQPLTPEIARRMDLPRDAHGLVITDVDPSGAAAAAGLRTGDVIEEVNGRRVESASALRDALTGATDRPAMVLVARNGTTLFVPLRAPDA